MVTDTCQALVTDTELVKFTDFVCLFMYDASVMSVVVVEWLEHRTSQAVNQGLRLKQH